MLLLVDDSIALCQRVLAFQGFRCGVMRTRFLLSDVFVVPFPAYTQFLTESLCIVSAVETSFALLQSSNQRIPDEGRERKTASAEICSKRI